jgi:ABC-type lipoprotein release transport system permease subunit
MGADKRMILKIFLSEGLLLGTIGSAFRHTISIIDLLSPGKNFI